jgi:hypothetical protein
VIKIGKKPVVDSTNSVIKIGKKPVEDEIKIGDLRDYDLSLDDANDPFRKPNIHVVKVIDIKDGYVQYYYINDKRYSSMSLNSFKHLTKKRK